MRSLATGIQASGTSIRWRAPVVIRRLLPLALVAAAGPASAQEAAAPATKPAVEVPGDISLEQMFADYLHFARMGRFAEAQAYARAMLARSDLKPEAMLALSEKYRNSIETLQMLISGSSIGDNAGKILEVINEGAVRKRKSPEQITEAIQMLAGTPTQRMVGMERLQYAGEYAVRWMVATLTDPARKDLHPYVERALPKIGKEAVNPLVAALEVKEDWVCQTLMDALGELGYPQALPYLRRIAADAARSESVRKTAARAIARIVATDPSLKEDVAPAEAFLDLAEQYYADVPSLRADERQPLANVWYLKNNDLVAVAIPRGIYGSVQCMRCCEDALALNAGMPEAVALWLAADFRREASLGMDVQSVETDERSAADLTRPRDYPRSQYFARCFGPRHAHRALGRAVRDRDAVVALGAVTALQGVASASELVGPEDVKQALTLALRFPDVLVRIHAALALAEALPPRDFHGSQEVVPILSSALELRGRPNVLIADPDPDTRRLLQAAFSSDNTNLIVAEKFGEAADRARREVPQLDLIVLASDIDAPSVPEALAVLRKDDRLELTPVVLVVKPGGFPVATKASAIEPRIERVVPVKFAGLDDAEMAALRDSLTDAWARARKSYGRPAITEARALALALEAADALRLIAMTGTSVFRFAGAEPALVRACSHADESMRLKAAAVLAWAKTETAQSAIARLALDSTGSARQRVAGLAILAESAKRFGRLMGDDLVNSLTDQALHEPDLAIRTAASQALGAMDLGSDRAAEIIRLQFAR